MHLLRNRMLLREWARYLQNNAWKRDGWRRFAPRLIAVAREFEYLRWPKHLERLVKGRDVLDVGCGMGLHGIGFVVSGVRSYTGVDPIVDPDSDVVKNLRRGRREACGWTPRQMMAQFPQLAYVRGSFDDLPPGRSWDVVALHNTTEHLMDIAGAFERIAQLLRPAGLLIFNHHNFYSWNGHHLAPKTVAAIDPEDPKQRKVIDWGHLDPDDELRGYLSTRVNPITIDELREVTRQRYGIEQWKEIRSDEAAGGTRLTAGILQRHAPLTRRDLETQSIYCVARLQM